MSAQRHRVHVKGGGDGPNDLLALGGAGINTVALLLLDPVAFQQQAQDIAVPFAGIPGGPEVVAILQHSAEHPLQGDGQELCHVHILVGERLLELEKQRTVPAVQSPFQGGGDVQNAVHLDAVLDGGGVRYALGLGQGGLVPAMACFCHQVGHIEVFVGHAMGVAVDVHVVPAVVQPHQVPGMVLVVDNAAVHAQHIHEQPERGGVSHAHRVFRYQHVMGREGGAAHARAADDAAGVAAYVGHQPEIDGLLLFIAAHALLNDLGQHGLRHGEGLLVLRAEQAAVTAQVGVGDVGGGADFVLATHPVAPARGRCIRSPSGFGRRPGRC